MPAASVMPGGCGSPGVPDFFRAIIHSGVFNGIDG